jgi:glutathione S-transferase
METRDSYLGTKSDVYTHVHDLPPQLGGCAAVGSAEQRAAAAAIDGSDGSSWHLPLADKPLAASLPSLSFEEWPGEDPARDRLAAAARLVSNRTAIARFAARGAPGGKRGNPAVSAPLADPFAVADEAALESVDAALRAVADALLKGHDGSEDGPRVVEEGAATPSQQQKTFSALSAAAAAGYLRDRVGVPRDLPLPAARQLRAHLNWFIDSVSR